MGILRQRGVVVPSGLSHVHLGVRHVVLPEPRQRVHGLLQEGQRSVDEVSLLELLSRHRSLLHALATRQVHEVELRHRGLLARIPDAARLEVDGEDAVRSTGRLVQDVRRGGAVSLAREEVRQRLSLVGAVLFGQALDDRLASARPRGERLGEARVVDPVHDLQIIRLRHVVGEEIVHDVVVNLEVRHPDLDLLVAAQLGLVKEVVDRPRDDAALVVRGGDVAAHGVRLTGARLSVREDRAVVTREHVIAHVRGAGAEDGLLAGVQQDVVEAELDGVCGVVDVARAPRFVRLLDLDGDGLAVGL